MTGRRRLAACLVLAPIVASAGGIDRSGQPLTILYKDGNVVELSLAFTQPDLTGKDLMVPQKIGDVADDFWSPGFGLKLQPTERFSLALIGIEDFGSDLEYPGDPAASAFGGTVARSDSYSISLIGRYAFTDNWALHGGVRANRADGEIALDGQAYFGPTVFSPATGLPVGGGVSGYRADLGNDLSFGYLVGGSYERPEIALRIAVTYFSPIVHHMKTTETFAVDANGDRMADATQSFDSPKTRVELPQAVNIDVQTGIAPRTLLFGSIRWADWSSFKVKPELFTDLSPPGLVNIDDTTTWTLGLGRQFTERLGGSAALLYEAQTGGDLVSPLSPRNGFTGMALGASYRVDQVELSGGLRYYRLGAAKPQTLDTARADFTGNSIIVAGARIAWYF